jgi:hypothetical protein
MLGDVARGAAELRVGLVVGGKAFEEDDRVPLRRAVLQTEDREAAYGRVAVGGGQGVQQRAHAVDRARVVAREQLEREERRAAARGALVLEAAPQELGLLPVAELPDRPVRDGALAVVGGPRLALDLVLPLRAQLCELALRALLRERGRLGSG